MDTLNQLGTNDVSEKANNIALEGHRLRQNLQTWSVINSELLNGATGSASSAESSSIIDHTALVSNAFFAAISIYLSGVYDYDMVLWRRWCIPVPTLAEEDVQRHVSTILSSASYALERTNISHLLYLFPLRVAGARCINKRWRDQVLMLLRRVGTNFIVAQEFEMELSMLWNQDKDITSITEIILLK